MCGYALVIISFLFLFCNVKTEIAGKTSTYPVVRSQTPSTRKPCDTEQIEYRLTKLEVQVSEKNENVRSELRETNRRLQALEYQENELQRSIDGLRDEFSRVTGVAQNIRAQETTSNNEQLNNNIDNLNKGIHLIATVLRGIKSDISTLKKNISVLLNTTSNILNDQQNLATKQFLSTSLIDVKHHQVFQTSHPSNSIPLNLPKNCQEVLNKGNNQSGIYLIQPQTSNVPFMVKCDLEKLGGGWTYVHNRFEGSQEFYNNWHDYKVGFGNIAGEFWLGLEKIHQLTGGEVNELLVELEDFESGKANAHYSDFSVGSELEGFALKVLGGYSGTAGDSLIYHAGSRFSTKDLDQDGWAEGSCAQSHSGAWWYRGCDTSNLNGKYLNGEIPEVYTYQGLYWGEFRGSQYSLKSASMLVRPRAL